MKQQKPYVRIQQSWLAPSERLLLLAMAKSLPQWVKPDHLTMLGVGGSCLCGIGFAASGRSPFFLWLAAAGLVVNWAGDSLDGNLARLRGVERPEYGFFVDHTSDIVSQALIFMGMAASPYLRFEMGCLLLMSYWLATMFTLIRTISAQVFQISYFGIGPTEIRIGLVVYAFSLLTVGPLPITTEMGAMSVMDVLAMVIFAAVMVSFLVMALHEAQRLATQEASSGFTHDASIVHPSRVRAPLLDKAVN